MNSQNYAATAWPIALIIITGIYGYWAVQRELVSSRPSIAGEYDVPDPVPTPGVRTIHSRMWQDPLSTTYKHWKALPREERAASLKSFSDSKKLSNAVQNVATSNYESESGKTSINTERALGLMLKWLGLRAELVPNSALSVGNVAERSNDLAKDMKEFFRSLVDKGEIETLCMPVFVPGGPYAEDKEKRLRIRYAVTTALAESGYALKYPRRMSYFVAKIPIRVLRGWREREMVIPVKLFRDKEQESQVLVLWINESELGLRPLLTAHRILNAAFSAVKKSDKFKLAMIGPASSDTLSKMALEIDDINDTFFPRVIYEANTFSTETGDDDKTETLYRDIQQLAMVIGVAACASEIAGAEEIRQNADIIGSTRACGEIRELTKEIKKVVGAGQDQMASETAETIHEAASAIDCLINEIRAKVDGFVDAAETQIRRAGDMINDKINNKIAKRATLEEESIKTEAEIISDPTICDAIKRIRETTKGLASAKHADYRKWGEAIKLQAETIELVEARAVIQREVNNIKSNARELFKQDVHKIIEKLIWIIREVTTDLPHKISVNNNTADARQDYAVIRREAENIKKTLEDAVPGEKSQNVDAAIKTLDAAIELLDVTSGFVDKAATGRFAHDYKEFAKSVAKIVQDDKNLKPVTVIQRATANIKDKVKQLEDGELTGFADVATAINEEANRIRLAHTHELIKEAAERIAQFAEKNNYTDVKAESDKITAKACEIIKQLASQITWNEYSNHWYASSYSHGNAKRMQGFMPFLSSTESGAAAVKLLSPRATMDDIQFAENKVIRLYRVIGTDRQLAESIHDELKLRGSARDKIVLITEHDTAYGRAFPATFENVIRIEYFETRIRPILERIKCLRCHGSTEGSRRFDWQLDQPESAITMIKLGDPDNSRLIERLSSQNEDVNHTIDKPQLDELKKRIEQGAEPQIISFKILRGIDGQLPGDDDNRNRAKQYDIETSPTDLPEIVERPPEGRTQYDYLRRLRYRIEQLDREHDDRVRAIGVVGSDVYDKLLVLRALKPHFPSAVFFTTDLDVIYNHSAERRHSRNLLIASHFDLRLGKELQESTPPFRDSYETATFLATRLAIHHHDLAYRNPNLERVANGPEVWATVTKHWFGGGEDEDDNGDGSNEQGSGIRPVLHVVGTTHTYPLTQFGEEEKVEEKLHPDSSYPTGIWHYFFVGGFTLVVMGGIWWLTYHERFRMSLENQGNVPWMEWLREQINRARDNRLGRFGYTSLRDLSRWVEHLKRLGKVNLGLLVLVAMGVVLLFVLCVRGGCSVEAGGFFGGYSTWPRKVVLSVTGISAFLSVGYVLVEFQTSIKEEVRIRNKEIGKQSSSYFQMAHIVKIAILALVIVYSGGMFVYGVDVHQFLVPGVFTLIALALLWYFRKRNARETRAANVILVFFAVIGVAVLEILFAWGVDMPEILLPAVAILIVLASWWYFAKRNAAERQAANLILDTDLISASGYALSAVIVMTLFGVFFQAFFEGEMNESHTGWHPASTSRGWRSRMGDWFAVVYAFGAVGLLLSTLLYLHLWCREFARKAPSSINDGYTDGEDMGRLITGRIYAGDDQDSLGIRKLSQFVHDLLWTIGRLSSISNRLTPVLLGLLFLLVIAYHPRLSPTPMPLSLVVITTLSVIAIIVSVLSLRWHFRKERDETLSALQLCLGEFGAALDEEKTAILKARKEQIEAISEGVFQSWNRSPIRWILGGGTALALVDLWVRWWTMGL